MIIHLIGPHPQIDFDTYPRSVVLTTAHPDPNDVHVYQLSQYNYHLSRTKLDHATEWDSGIGQTKMRMTRLIAIPRKSEEFFCYAAPMADNLQLNKRTMMLVVIKVGNPNSFVFIGPFSTTAVYHFLRGEIPSFGATVLLHRRYSNAIVENVPGELPWAKRQNHTTIWKRLMDNDAHD